MFAAVIRVFHRTHSAGLCQHVGRTNNITAIMVTIVKTGFRCDRSGANNILENRMAAGWI
jgi:hypothetical protein